MFVPGVTVGVDVVGVWVPTVSVTCSGGSHLSWVVLVELVVLAHSIDRYASHKPAQDCFLHSPLLVSQVDPEPHLRVCNPDNLETHLEQREVAKCWALISAEEPESEQEQALAQS